MLLAMSLGTLVTGVLTAFSPSILVFMVLRWCVAVSSCSLYTTGYVYCMELVGGRLVLPKQTPLLHSQYWLYNSGGCFGYSFTKIFIDLLQLARVCTSLELFLDLL